MATIIEHDKRKHEILQKALDVFIEEGFEDVTFQKIANRCGITRTTLYIYFKNKREIFLWSIKQLTSRLEAELVSIVKNKSVSAETALRSMLEKIIDECQENQKLFSVLLPYLLQLQKAGIDSGERVRRRVIRLRHLLSLLVIQGIKNGEFNNINVKDTNEL
ncbi:MAG: TetR/AcrR family transcriptional regulator, partial [Treponema porcinum]|nr:TetR/AcrR family transcriptional regulator [Treponema porcinum]